MPGDRHLARRGRPPLGDAPRAPGLRAHDESGVVGPYGAGPHEDRVAAGPHGVDAVEVGRVRQHESLLRRVVEAAVERHGPAQHDVRALSHAYLPSRAGRRPWRLPWRRPSATPRHPRRGPRRPAGDEEHRPRKRRDEDDRPVGHGHRQTLRRPQPHGGEHPGGRALARTPPGDVEREPGGQEHDEREGHEVTDGKAHPGRPGGDDEGRDVPGEDEERRDDDPQGCRRVQQRARLAPEEARHPPGPAPALPVHGPARADEEEQRRGRDPSRYGEPGRRERARHREHGHRGDGEDDLAGGALPDHRPQPSTHVGDAAAVPDPAGDVAEHAAREGDVEELGAVAGGHRGRHRELDAQAAGDDPPAPGGTGRRHRCEHHPDGERPGVQPAQGVEHRPVAHDEDEGREHGYATERPRPAPPRCPDARADPVTARRRVAGPAGPRAAR